MAKLVVATTFALAMTFAILTQVGSPAVSAPSPVETGAAGSCQARNVDLDPGYGVTRVATTTACEN